MAGSKSMQELHRAALELERTSYGLDRVRAVTVRMAETPWTRDPRRQAPRPIPGDPHASGRKPAEPDSFTASQ